MIVKTRVIGRGNKAIYTQLLAKKMGYPLTVTVNGAEIDSITVNGTPKTTIPTIIMPDDTITILFSIDPIDEYPLTVPSSGATVQVLPHGITITDATGAVEITYSAQLATYSNGAMGARLGSSMAFNNTCACGDSVYVLGGTVASGQYASYVSTSYRYDAINRTCTQLSISPTAWIERGIAAYNGSVYLFGGQTSGVGKGSTCQKYDTTTGTLTSIASLPAARSALSYSCITDEETGKIYIFGGAQDNGTWGANYIPKTVYVYDVANNSFSTTTNLPVGLYGVIAAKHGRYVYLFGGTKMYKNGSNWNTTTNTTIYKFNLSTQTFSSISATFPTDRSYLFAYPYNDKIYFVTCQNYASSVTGGTGYLAVFDPTTEQFLPFYPQYNTERYGFGGGFVGNRLYLMGGATKNGRTNTIQYVEVSQTPVATHTVSVSTVSYSTTITVYDGSGTSLGTISAGETKSYTINTGYIVMKVPTNYEVWGTVSSGIEYMGGSLDTGVYVWKVTADGTMTNVNAYEYID